MSKEEITFGQLIKEYRIKANLTQRDLGTRLQVSHTQIHQIESSEFYPKKRMLARLCNEFDLDYWTMSDLVVAERMAAERIKLKGAYYLTEALLDRLVTTDVVVNGILRDVNNTFEKD